MLDSITPGNPHYNEKSRLAKTMQKDGSHLGQRDRRFVAAGARQQPDDLLRLPQLVGADVLRLPSFDDRRIRRMPMLHNEGLITRNWTSYNFQVLRDDVYMPGDRWHRHRPSRRAGALGLRRAGEFAERQSRLDLLSAADDFGRRLQRAGVQYLRPAHGARERNQGLHGLPRLAGRRQQCLDGAVAAAGHELHELHGPLHLRGRRRRGFSRRRVAEHTSLRRSSAAICSALPIPTTTAST